MPSTYAHYRFGKDVLASLGGDERGTVSAHRTLYDIGLHGPDILFYYDALHRNPVNSIGFAMHDRPGREFFEASRSALATTDRGAGLAYLYGFVCHFVLDSACHPYIEDKINESGVSHTRIESEFDRALMVRDGLDPVRHCLTGHIRPSEEDCRVISAFFQDVTPEQVSKALSDMVRYNRLLVAPGRFKRYLIDRKLRATGNYEAMHGLLIGFEPDPRCEDSCSRLDEIYAECVPLAVNLIRNLDGYLDGTERLSERYDRTFSIM